MCDRMSGRVAGLEGTNLGLGLVKHIWSRALQVLGLVLGGVGDVDRKGGATGQVGLVDGAGGGL